MHPAVAPLAAPPGYVDPDALWWTGGIMGVLLLINLLIVWDNRRKRRRVPLEQLREELRKALRVGAPNVRGQVRIDPSRYPGIPVGEAEAIADEEGFDRQTHGTKGTWLFVRVTPETSAWPAGMDAQERSFREAARSVGGTSRAERNRYLVRAFLCGLPGVPIGIALALDWLNGGLSVEYTEDLWFYVVAHLLALGLLTGAFFSFRRYLKAARPT